MLKFILEIKNGEEIEQFRLMIDENQKEIGKEGWKVIFQKLRQMENLSEVELNPEEYLKIKNLINF